MMIHLMAPDFLAGAGALSAATGGEELLIGVWAEVVPTTPLSKGGAAAWWFMRTPPPAEDTEAAAEGGGEAAPPEHKEEKPRGEGIVEMDQFLVNLADKDASRFVRVKLGLVVESKKEGVEMSQNEVAKARLRSAILDILAQQTSDRLVTPEGKAELKKLIADHTNAALGEKKVLDVLFTDFVVQF